MSGSVRRNTPGRSAPALLDLTRALTVPAPARQRPAPDITVRQLANKKNNTSRQNNKQLLFYLHGSEPVDAPRP